MDKEELELLKMEAELEVLRNQLSKQKSEVKPSDLTRFFNNSNKSIAVLIALTTLLAGIWGLIVPVRNYFNLRQQQMHYNLSKDMIDLSYDLKYDSTRQEAVLLLSYYDLNAMPILLYQLEYTSRFSSMSMVDDVIKSISLIYLRNQKEVTSEIIYYFTNLFKQAKPLKTLDQRKYNGLLNFGDLINKITFQQRDKERLDLMVESLLAEMNEDQNVIKNMEKFVNDLDDFVKSKALQ